MPFDHDAHIGELSAKTDEVRNAFAIVRTHNSPSGNPIVETEEYIDCSKPSPNGFILSSLSISGQNNDKPKKLPPHAFGAIPHIENFAGETNIVGNCYIAKRRGETEVFVPEWFKGYVPAIQKGINYENFNLGEETFRNRWLLIRISRHTSANGYPHQPEQGQWHHHGIQGTSSYQLASNVAQTEFPTFVFPERAFIRFEEGHIHRSPTTIERRAFMGLGYYDKDRDPKGRLGLHRNWIARRDATDPSRMPEYREAGSRLLQHKYPVREQVEDLRRWMASELRS